MFCPGKRRVRSPGKATLHDKTQEVFSWPSFARYTEIS